MFKKKTGKVSKTFLASMVIFNLVFTTAALPVVSLAYDGSDKTESASQTTKGDSGKVEKGGGTGGTDGRTNPGDGSGKDGSSKGGGKGGGGGKSSSFNPHRAPKGEVKGEETASCDVGNLIVNGSFETPDVNNVSDWNIYPDGTSGLAWNVAWNGTFVGAPKTANMEIQNGVNGWNAYLGTQYTELDSDWGGPSDPMFGEQASTVISQTIDTVPGNTYSLHFAFAARPGTMASENKLGIYIDDGVFDLSTVSSFGEYYSDQPYWIVRDFEFKAYNEHTKIAFADIGTPNSVGSFLDDVRVNCLHEGNNGCPANNMIYARVKLTPQPYGWRNWGNGNTSGKIFVGGSNASNVYESNEWFPLTNPDGSFINDPEMMAANYANVPGLALQRNEGKIRIVLFGYLYPEYPAPAADGRIEVAQNGLAKPVADKAGNKSNPNYYMTNRELSQGSLEFSTDMVNRSTVVVPTSQMSDPVNPMDHVAGVHQYHPGSDSFGIVSNLSQWHMLATTGSDGFYTYYSHGSTGPGDDDCDNDGGDKKVGSLIVNKIIQGEGNGTFSFYGPMGSFDITTVNGEGAKQINDLDEGNYSVTEYATEGWHMVSNSCTNVHVVEDNAAECTIVNAMDDDNGNDDPGIEVGDRCVLWGTDFPMDRITITNNDGTLDHNNIFVFDLNTFHADIPGSYPLTVTLKDDEGNIIDGPTVFVFTVAPEGAKDCGNGNGGENTPPTVTAPETVCILTSVTQQSYNFLKDVTTNDADGDTLTLYFSHNIVFGEVGGPFTITYTVYDSHNANSTDTTVVNVKSDCGDGGTGGGDDDNPVLTVPGDACIVKGSVESFDLLAGVSAVDFAGDAIVLDTEGEDANLAITGSVNVNENGTYPLVYTVTDPFGTDQEGRTITIANDCSNGGGGGGEGCDEAVEDCDNGGGGGGGGGGSHGGGSHHNRGEVLGAETGSCVAFVQYNDTGSTKSEVKALQTFLNEYLGTNLTVDGVYNRATTQAVHDFQAMHWDDIIDPWTPPLSPNTTGREYKTTRATINAIMDCPEAPVYLEDPQTMFSIIEVKNQKAFTQSQIDKVTELLLEAHSGEVMGAVDAK